MVDQDTDDKNVTLLGHTTANEFKIFFVENVWDQRYSKCISLLSCLAGGYGAL